MRCPMESKVTAPLTASPTVSTSVIVVTEATCKHDGVLFYFERVEVSFRGRNKKSLQKTGNQVPPRQEPG